MNINHYIGIDETTRRDTIQREKMIKGRIGDKMIRLCLADCLQKIWQDKFECAECGRVSCFENEIADIQLAVINEGMPQEDCTLTVASDLPVEIRRVGYVPGDFTDHPEADEYVIAKGLHVFPDPLLPVGKSGIALKGNCVNVFWMSVGTGERMAEGVHLVRITLSDKKGELLGETQFEVQVMCGVLPECDIPVTDWMHYDCICNFYNVKPFSKRFWKLTESFLRTAVEHGINTVYVPLFTPPLDTRPGGERTTVQLVDVFKEKGAYFFDFSRLAQFLELARRCGSKFYEFSHLFTQWGAQACPKIVAKTDGKKRRIFGWDTPADGAEYTAFLQEFQPELGQFLRQNGYKENSFIHISDEPSAYWLKDYTARRAFIKSLLPDFTHIDALSEIEFLEQGLVDIPVAVTENAQPFVQSGKPFWVYYCFPQCYRYLSNRIMNMPSERTRVLGMQLYLNGASGFLHWGYNFYNTALSVRQVDPFFETDAGGFFESGDAFIVYPGAEGAYSSLRLEVFREAIQDYRALKLLESLVGREKAVSLLKKCGLEGFTGYPHGSAPFLSVRQAIDAAIAENLKTEI